MLSSELNTEFPFTSILTNFEAIMVIQINLLFQVTIQILGVDPFSWITFPARL